MNPDQADTDGDGYGNMCDCNDNNPEMHDRLCCFVDKDNDSYYDPYPYTNNDG